MIAKAFEFIQGHKTYFVAFAIGCTATAHALGYIGDDEYKTILGFLNSAGVATMAAKMNHLNKKMDEQ